MSTSNPSLRQQIANGLSAGLVIGVTEVIFAISLAALIFAANGIGLILLGAIPPLLLWKAGRSLHSWKTPASSPSGLKQ